MKKYIVICKIYHEKNPDGKQEVHMSIIEANSYGEAEMKAVLNWTKFACTSEVIQITLHS